MEKCTEESVHAATALPAVVVEHCEKRQFVMRVVVLAPANTHPPANEENPPEILRKPRGTQKTSGYIYVCCFFGHL